MNGFGEKHHSKPVTSQQKIMSKRHLRHRASLERMKSSPRKEKLKKFYDLSHAKEHLISPSLGSMGKKLAKLVVKQQKKSGLMSLASMKKDKDSDDS
jgi:hypothetical protein